MRFVFHSMVSLLLLGGITQFIHCGGDPCADLSCACANTEDCPDDYACGTEICYPRGLYPLHVACNENSDCADDRCQAGLGICVAPCSAGCAQGTLCQGDDCLPFHSLPLDATCRDTRLCPLGVNCIANSCAVTCSQGYTTEGCAAEHYCAVAETPWCVIPQPACDPAGPPTCPDDPGPPRVARQCVDVGDGLGVCRRGCTYDVDSNNIYSDDCDSRVGSFPATCASIGEGDTAACIEAASMGGGSGNLCNNGTRLCAVGHACVSGVCRALCTSASSCNVGSCRSAGGAFLACY